jgi:EAL domain-containing protein (putative c-di-GMP-specific phosphodiesterase class I)
MDVVKIDKSFVDQVALGSEGEAMVRSVIDMSSALGLTTIAEGVEQDDQLAMLDRMGCDNVQGYLYAEPMPSKQLADMLTKLRADAAPRSHPALQST